MTSTVVYHFQRSDLGWESHGKRRTNPAAEFFSNTSQQMGGKMQCGSEAIQVEHPDASLNPDVSITKENNCCSANCVKKL